jgi:hypothetical protein
MSNFPDMIHFLVCVVKRLNNSFFIHSNVLTVEHTLLLFEICYFFFQSIIPTPRKYLEYYFCTKGFPAHSTITKVEGQWFRTGYDNEVQVLPVAVA